MPKVSFRKVLPEEKHWLMLKFLWMVDHFGTVALDRRTMKRKGA
jgi:hypothetical protein